MAGLPLPAERGGNVKAKNSILIVLALSFCAVAPTAEAKRKDKGQVNQQPAKEVVDVLIAGSDSGVCQDHDNKDLFGHDLADKIV